MKFQKTNALRILDGMGISYRIYEYPHGEEVLSGTEVAVLIGKRPEEVYKTLVTTSVKEKYYVFVIPSDAELDLKKAAKAAGEKSVAMVKAAELFPLTGYVRGGCTAIGMKKAFPCYVDESVASLEKIVVSAGRIGMQMELLKEDYLLAARAGTMELKV